MRGLADKSVLVTGGASGIGRAICLRLGKEGALVGVLDLDASGAERSARELETAGARAIPLSADIRDGAAVERAVAAFAAAAGAIHGLVNNAGWDEARPFLDSDPALWRKIIDVNLYGPLHVTKAVLTRMVAQGAGRIVSIASDAGRVGSSGEAVYSACKAGIIAFTKTVAREVAREGITLNAVCPGPTDTPLLQGIDPTGKLQKSLERAIPMGRVGRPEDLAGMVAFLLSDDAAYMTGQTISVSGGLTMQ
jgi:2-hydroxycyclohexanecarboxyl-CoA dehydrogenase